MGKWELNSKKCIYCAGCVSLCPTSALSLHETRLECDAKKCTYCQICEKGCPARAITVTK